MEAEEETDEAERAIFDDCEFADAAGDGGGEGAGATAGGKHEIGAVGSQSVRGNAGFSVRVKPKVQGATIPHSPAGSHGGCCGSSRQKAEHSTGEKGPERLNE